MSGPFSAAKGGGPFSSKSSGGPFSGGGSSGGGGGGLLGGIGSFFENLAIDVKNTAFGMPAGMVQLFKHPLGSLEAMAKSTWHDWSPLFHGQFAKEWHQFMAHPLAPILDVSGLVGLAGAPFTAGLSLGDTAFAEAARTVLEAGDLGAATKLNEAARLVRSGRTAAIIRYGKFGESRIPSEIKVLSGNPAIQARQIALHKLGGTIDPYLPKWWTQEGKGARAFEREMQRRGLSKVDMNNAMLAGSAQLQQMMEAGAHLAKGAPQLETELLKHMHDQLGLHAFHFEPPAGAALGLPDNILRLRKQVDTLQRRHDKLSAKVDQGKLPAAEAKQLAIAPGEVPPVRVGHTIYGPQGQALSVIGVHAMSRIGGALSVAKDRLQAAETTFAKKIGTTPEQVALDTGGKMLKPPKGFWYVRREFPKIKEDLPMEEKIGKAFSEGKFFTTNPREAAIAPEGKFLIVPKHDSINYGLEARNSSKDLVSLFKTPSKWWKKATIGWSPKVVMNTAVGNSIMTLLDRPGSFLHLHDATRAVKGDTAAVRELAKSGVYRPSFIQTHFRDVIHHYGATFGSMKMGVEPTNPMVEKPLEDSRAFSKGSRIRGVAETGFYGGVHATEQRLKAAMITSEVKGAPEVRAYLAKGMGLEDAANKALAESPALRDEIARRALRTVGNYQTFSKGEKALVNFVPFFSWDRHIALHVAHIVSEKPALAAGLVAAGNEGQNAQLSILGDVPLYMRTNLPLSLLGFKSGLSLDTRGLNPYSSVADLVGAGLELANRGKQLQPSEELAGEINPLITGAVEAATGKSLLTDSPVDTHGGVLSTAAINAFNELPQMRIARQLAFGPPQKAHAPVYNPTLERLLTRYIGVPLNEPNLGAAQGVQASILSGGKKKKNPF